MIRQDYEIQKVNEFVTELTKAVRYMVILLILDSVIWHEMEQYDCGALISQFNLTWRFLFMPLKRYSKSLRAREISLWVIIQLFVKGNIPSNECNIFSLAFTLA